MHFAGFDGDWIQNTLSSVTNVYDGTHQTPKYTKSGVMFLSAENIKNLQSNKFISKDSFYKEFKISPTKGDVLMTRIGDVGTANVVEDSEPKAYYVTLALLKAKELDPYFLKASITAPFVQQDIWYRTLHIAFPKKINMNEIAKVAINTPNSKNEQIKIGSFFQNLDQQLKLYQAKHSKLQKLKKAMLGKMFPREGAKVPEVRFAGFSEDWEVTNFRKITEVRSASRVHKHEWTKSGVPFFRTSDVVAYFKGTTNKKAFISYELYKSLSSKSGAVKEGDLLITGGGSVGIPYLIRSNKPLYFKDADLLWIKNNDHVGYFLYTFFITSAFRDFLDSISHIGTISHYTITQANLTPITIPKYEEQAKIGNYFQNLDRLIALQQQQIDKLKNIKQSFLEKMFV